MRTVSERFDAEMDSARLRQDTLSLGLTRTSVWERAGSGLPLLCLHGLGDSSATWPELLAHPALADHPAIVPDVPGFGHSPRFPDATRTLRGQARFMIEVLDALGVDRFVVLGHSMGGAVGTHLAELAGDRCAGLVSYEGNLTIFDCSLSAEAVAADAETGYSIWRQTVVPRLEAMAGAGEAGVARFIPSFLSSDSASYLEASGALVEESRDSTIGKRYVQLETPRIYLHGGQSSPPGTIAFLREHGLDEVLYPDANHWVHWDARDPAAAVTAKFISRL